MHTAPGHGHEDYVVGLKYGIPPYCPVDPAGRFYHAEGAAGVLPEELIGKNVWQANPIVMEILQQHGALLAHRRWTIRIRTAGDVTSRPFSAQRNSGSSAWIETIFVSARWKRSGR